MPNLRKWSSFRLSITLGFVSWLALSYAWGQSTPNGAVDRVIGGLFAPVTRAGYRVFEIMFPDWASPHSGLVYLATLFAALSNFLVITAIWYVCVRSARALRPEWAPAPASPRVDHKEDDFDLYDGDHGPDYLPFASDNTGYKVITTIDREKFKWRAWKLFRKHRGHWPVFSIVFPYLALVGFIVNTLAFFKVRDQNDWSTSKSWTVGAVLTIAWCGFFAAGQKLMWKLDWGRFGRDQVGFEPKGRHLS